MNLKHQYILATTGLLLILLSCDQKTTTTAEKSLSPGTVDTTYHGYNELANPDHRTSFTISDYNTDNEEIKNIDRPGASTIKTQLDTSILFGIWTSDPNGPHADFYLTSKSFFVVDYDGDGDMPYELYENKLKIYYNDFVQEGDIISVGKDTLKIKWKDYEQTTSFVRWTQ